MGMESYNIMLLPYNVQINRCQEYWTLCGSSDLPVSAINQIMDNLCKGNTNEEEYIFGDIIDVKLYSENDYFQGVEIRGCLSCIEEGVKKSYELYQFLNQMIPLDFYVLNQKVNVDNEKELYDRICWSYSEKIEWFRKQYGDKKILVTSGNFYNEIKKRRRWYYRIFH